MPKLQEIFTTVASCVIATRLTDLQNAFYFEQVKVLKNISKKVYTSKIKKERWSRDKSNIWDFKNA